MNQPECHICIINLLSGISDVKHFYQSGLYIRQKIYEMIKKNAEVLG